MGAASSIVGLVVVLAAAQAGGRVAARLGQPRVLGELGVGLVIGNLTLAGYTDLDFLRTDRAVNVLSQLAAIVLLFEAGLQSTVPEMRRIGVAATLIAALGVAGSLLTGWMVALWLRPADPSFSQFFLGATLTATSVGVSARVLKELGRARSAEARLILGAATVDDILGLVVLAVTGAVVSTGSASGLWRSGAIAIVLLKAGAFLVGGLALGMFISPRLLTKASRSMAVVLLVSAFAFCFGMAALANLSGLSPVLGAFAAGVIIEEWHYQDFIDRKERTLNDLVEPVATFLVPAFFVVAAIRTDLSGLMKPSVVGMAAALTAAALAGKSLCAAGVVGKRGAGVDRVVVALGMFPRGEVTLIFAGLGASVQMGGRPLVGADVFLAIMITVVATTVLTPMALKWRLARQ